MMNQKNNNQKVNNEEKNTGVCTINIQPRKFEMTHAVSLINTKQLTDMIDEVFGSTFAFADYMGSRINVNNNGVIVAEIAFTPLDTYTAEKTKKLVALESTIAPNKGGDMMAKIARWNGAKTTSTRYRLTQEAKEALTPFVSPNFRNGFDHERNIPKINWGAASQEICLGTVFGNPSPQIAFKVNVDIVNFINRFYGSKTEEGNHVSYMITVQRALGMVPELQMQQGQVRAGYANNYAFEIIQIDEESSIKANATIIGAPVSNSMGFSNVR